MIKLGLPLMRWSSREEPELICRAHWRNEVRRCMYSAGHALAGMNMRPGEGDLAGPGEGAAPLWHLATHTQLPSLNSSALDPAHKCTQVEAGCLTGHRLPALQACSADKVWSQNLETVAPPPPFTTPPPVVTGSMTKKIGVFAEVLSSPRSRTLCQVGA